MPKVSKLQSNFNAGEIAPLVQGRVDAARYKAALATCLNYIPTLQGPLVRRPGTRYVANVKNAAGPNSAPTLIPFQFSNAAPGRLTSTTSFILEFGDQYIRFYTSGIRSVTSGTMYQLTGYSSVVPRLSTPGTGLFNFTAVRSSFIPGEGEAFTNTVTVPAGSILELVSPYSAIQAQTIKWSQTTDSLILTHSNYQPYRLQFNGVDSWDLKPLQFRDGPYLPINSYATLGDSASVSLIPSGATGGATTTGPIVSISGVASSGGPNLIRVTTATAHGKATGDSVYISGVTGTTEANNTSLVVPLSWTVSVVDSLNFDLFSTVFTNNYISGGKVFPALFQGLGAVPGFQDVGRNVRIIPPTGSSAWGYITAVNDAAHCTIALDPFGINFFSNVQASSVWQLGVWHNGPFPLNYFPSACCFHQNRLIFAGAPNAPQRVDGSVVGDYTNFAANDLNTLAVAANNAISRTLNSTESNPLSWLKTTAQGLLSGTASAEWAIAASTQNEALTPTNFNATQVSFFGSANVDAVQIGNGTLYVNKTGRKIREMNYFFQLGTFRSTDLTELAEHITIPAINKLVVQKETQPLLWAMGSSGTLQTMVYNRDDLSLSAGWARQQLGGQSDSAGTPPLVLSVACIPSPDLTFDQVWMVTQRYINGSSQIMVEYVSKFFDDSVLPEDAAYVDCSAVYYSPVTISGITVASNAVVTANNHGFSNGDSVKIVGVGGLNVSTVDIDGNKVITNPVNEKTFQVGSSVTNSFNLLDFTNLPLNTNSSAVYVSGGQVAKLVSTISGLTNLRGETVGVWADGSYHPDIIVASSGVAVLNYPAAKVQFGYRYNSDAQTLTTMEGSAQGSAIGSMRRINRYAFMLHNVGDLQVGTNFNNLIPTNFAQADQQLADNAIPLFSGMIRDGVESTWNLTDQLCFRQNSPAPGMIQSLTLFLEEQDV